MTRIGRPGQFQEFRRFCIQRLERASLIATDKAPRAALAAIRPQLPGRAGAVLTYGSDLKSGRGVKRIGPEGYRASGWVGLKSRNPRAVGMIESLTEGGEIRPKRSRYLWIATDEIPRRAGRYKMTPSLYRKGGFEQRIGPLIEIPGRHRGERLLIVKSVTVDRMGRPGRARRLPRRGSIGSSRQKKDFIVAFVGIVRTARSPVTDVRQVISLEQARLPDYRAAALRADGLDR